MCTARAGYRGGHSLSGVVVSGIRGQAPYNLPIDFSAGQAGFYGDVTYMTYTPERPVVLKFLFTWILHNFFSACTKLCIFKILRYVCVHIYTC